jgi:putative transposase
MGEGIYHVLNRGVDQREIFLEEKDYLRFIHNLFVFNDVNPTFNNFYNFSRKGKDKEIDYKQRKRQPLVEILAFCLMPNHYHLLLIPLVEDGIFKFVKKLDIGYAKYFNQKYNRKGALFEGRYKSILIKEEAHFLYLPYYIHFNPLDLKFPEWRQGKIKNSQKAMKFLENYRWSSFLDYIGERNFPSITQRDFLLKIFNSPFSYKKDVINWLKEMEKEQKVKRTSFIKIFKNIKTFLLE